MATYKITHNSTGLVVNLHIASQTSAVPNGTRVSLYSWQNNNDQKWVAEEIGGYTLLRLARDTTKVLNRHSTNNNAHVWSYDGSVATQHDSLVSFENYNGYTRIKLVYQNLYLTKNSADNYLSWTNESANNRQYFTITDLSGNGSNTNYATYPCSTMNITQTYNGNTSHIQCSSGTPFDFPTDEACENTGRSWMYCPCDEMEVVRLSGVNDSDHTNAIWLKSTSKVNMPIGEDYLVMMVIHPEDDDLGSIQVGQKFHRGDPMFREGQDGVATGNHFHISLGTGNGIVGTGWQRNNLEGWVLLPAGQPIKIEEGFYLDTSFTTVEDNKGITFINKP